MAIVRYRPWGANAEIQNEIRSVFDRFFQNGEADQSNVVTSDWAPRVDIREEAERFLIEADIPGVDPKDIEIHMENGMLTIRGERKSGHGERRGHHGERQARRARDRHSEASGGQGAADQRQRVIEDRAEGRGLRAEESDGALLFPRPSALGPQPL